MQLFPVIHNYDSSGMNIIVVYVFLKPRACSETTENDKSSFLGFSFCFDYGSNPLTKSMSHTTDHLENLKTKNDLKFYNIGNISALLT